VEINADMRTAGSQQKLRRHQAHDAERTRRSEGSGALFEVRRRALPKVLPDSTGHQELHIEHRHQGELLDTMDLAYCGHPL